MHKTTCIPQMQGLETWWTPEGGAMRLKEKQSMYRLEFWQEQYQKGENETMQSDDHQNDENDAEMGYEKRLERKREKEEGGTITQQEERGGGIFNSLKGTDD